ncbi:MarR family winged helix-turn-helix transcriptional regulator [Rhizorhapis suberifaciens]|uniref:DNA-binding MarR family transcriptional regulator n=1 Tax=Rhizorhapis suberifaciens TaxID=13656 RepID=A0A840HTR7_9SPHN|nr:MarR family transcriptional regulator [Rhizorhapis suberifaciens]MBB4640999.1 DNA-binding MarR family transcriptional regulator [Rhizorhapis suberifaciens]
MASPSGIEAVSAEEPRDGVTNTRFLDGLVGYWLRRASNVVSADFASTVQEGSGLRSVLVSILSVVDANPGISQTQLGRSLNIQRANMVPLLSGLIDDGLLRREASAEDKRVLDLYITPAGETKLKEATAMIMAHEKRLLASFTAKERQTLIDLLAKITRAEAQ